MRGFTKVCVLAGGLCILIGGGLAASAAFFGGTFEEVIPDQIGRKAADSFREEFHNSLGPYGVFMGEGFDDDWDDSIFDMEEYQEDQEVSKRFSAEEIKKLEVEAEIGKVVLVQDPDADEILLSGNRTWWSCQKEGEKLKVQLDSDRHKDEDGLLVTIHVPAGYRFEKVDLQVKGQGVDAKYLKGRKYEGTLIEMRSLSADVLEAQAEMGTIKILDGDIGTLEASCQTGTLGFQGTVSGNIEAECTVGEVCMELNDPKEAFNYEIQCSMGAVTIGEEDFAQLDGQKDIDNGAEKKMELDCQVGAIQVRFANQA